MILKDLLAGIRVLESTADLQQEISEVVHDSRKASPGCLFVAVSGFATDGNLYIPKAMAAGAFAVVTAKRPQEAVPYILVESDRAALAQLGCNRFSHPSRAMTMVGVTGTNGKTSVTLLLKQVLEKTLGAKVGLIGTMSNCIGALTLPAERTTPESYDLQALLAQMRDAGCTHVVMEVSSHAIALDRVAGIEYDVAAFTNLTEDHLDFHKTMEDYCDTKAELFSRCRRAVMNCDDPWFDRMQKKAKCSVFTTSNKNSADLTAENCQLQADGVAFTVVCDGEQTEVRLPIPGGFTVYNALTVLGIAHELGIGLPDAARALADCTGVKGRVEVVPTPGMPFTVLIDYAHTPDGLENVLSSVRGYCKGRLIAVFGCGGDRDPIKRPIMGRIGTELSDLAIITSDNPRSEEPMDIIEQILAGVAVGAQRYEVICDRRKAIRYAMDKAEKNDIIVLAGKGHETYQEICGVKYPLDEREEVAEHLKEMRK